MHHRTARALLTAVVALAPASVASAAPWQAPVPAAYGSPVFARDGSGALFTEGALLPMSAAGVGGEPRALPGSGAVMPVAYGAKGIAVLRFDRRAVVFTGPVGAPTRRLPVTEDTRERPIALAANEVGGLAVSTCRPRPRTVVVSVYTRRVGGRFRLAFRDLKSGSACPAPGLALTPQGNAAIAFLESDELLVHQAGESRAQRLVEFHGGTPRFLVDEDGRVSLAWLDQNGHYPYGPVTVGFATAAPGHRFGAARVVAHFGPSATRPPLSVGFVKAGAREGLLAWTSFDGTRVGVQAARVAGGRIGPAQAVAPDHSLEGLAATASGAAIVLSSPAVAPTSPSAPSLVSTLDASVSAGPTLPFAAPERVVAPAVAGSLAIDPVSGRAFLVFAEGPPGMFSLTVRDPLG
jgi:hypothetical protein